MRYDTLIYLCTESAKSYNTETGDYEKGDYEKGELQQVACMASVNDTRAQTMHLVYGEIRQGSFTVQLLNHYDAPFDYILMNNKKYSVDFRRKLRHKETLVISQVQ